MKYSKLSMFSKTKQLPMNLKWRFITERNTPSDKRYMNCGAPLRIPGDYASVVSKVRLFLEVLKQVCFQRVGKRTLSRVSIKCVND